MRRLITVFLGFIVAFTSSVTSASAETFDNPQGNFNWKVYDYNPSDQALRVRQPFYVQQPDGGIAFNFIYEPDTALFMTGHPSYRGDLLGDIRGKTLTARVGVTVTSGSPVFNYFGEPGDCGHVPANVRFYFQTRPHGPFNPSDYWWSNPVALSIDSLRDTQQEMTNRVDPELWSNYFGMFGVADPVGFNYAASNAVAIGVSFGGGCFFENGVGIVPGTGSAYFELMEFSATPSAGIDPLAQVIPELILAPFTTPTIISIP